MNRGRPFELGNKCGRGRQRGSRNKKTIELQKLLDEYAPALMKKALGLALQGEVPLLRMFLDRKLPKISASPVKIGRMPSGTLDEVSQAHQTLIDEVASGNLDPAQAVHIDSLLETSRKVIVAEEVMKRLEALEQLAERTGQ